MINNNLNWQREPAADQSADLYNLNVISSEQSMVTPTKSQLMSQVQEQRQLSSIASFGQINNRQIDFQNLPQNVSLGGEMAQQPLKGKEPDGMHNEGNG